MIVVNPDLPGLGVTQVICDFEAVTVGGISQTSVVPTFLGHFGAVPLSCLIKGRPGSQLGSVTIKEMASGYFERRVSQVGRTFDNSHLH
jgi:hypothetical protein